MAKRTPPPAGYWITCLDPNTITPCCKQIHDVSCIYLTVFKTDGTLKNMEYVHHHWGTGWCKLTWTCFPFIERREGNIQHYLTLSDLKTALGNHKINGMV